MIFLRTILNVTDNTGARRASFIGVLGRKGRAIAEIGDIVKVNPVNSAHFPLPAPRSRSEAMINYKLNLLGLNGIVIKSHGGANSLAFANAIEEAVIEVEKNVPKLIRQKVEIMLEENK